jgi:hypothetical protein
MGENSGGLILPGCARDFFCFSLWGDSFPLTNAHLRKSFHSDAATARKPWNEME